MFCFDAYFFDLELCDNSFFGKRYSQKEYTFKMAYDDFFESLFKECEFPIQTLRLECFFCEETLDEF